ncbi:Esterase/lipase/thioesterase [Tulasnella sp. JGI-2019a]|nr:Esterase/lipase/thioesterase [Tulasnella sp. JGI-2019a]
MKYSTALASLAALVASLTSVKAHGYVSNGIIGGVNFTGYLPYTDPYYVPPPERIIRAIPGNGPITDMTLIDLQCNGWSDGGVIGSAPAPLYATAAAGSSVFLQWTEWPDTHFGPVITYMAKVPSGTNVTTWLPGTAAVWFKVDEAGLYADGTWAANGKLIDQGSSWTFTIPAQLAPGQYIIRHEIIALHSSYTYPGAQSYPSCIQIQVTGSGTVTPSGSNLVAFPGNAYTSTTPGLVYSIWNPNSLANVSYPIPGPPLYFGSSTSTSTTKATTTSTTTTKATTTTTTKATTTTSTSTKATTTTTTAASSTSAAAAYAQCGGSGWTGATTCVAGSTCTYSSAYYSQCIPS